MTSKQVYEATAIELSKIQAPALKLYEFNYFFNQAIRQFVNKVYNVYDVNQQTTDDLRVLKSTATLIPKRAADTNNKAIASLFCAQVLKPDYFTQSEIAISTKKSYKFAAVVPNFLAVRCLKVRMPTAE